MINFYQKISIFFLIFSYLFIVTSFSIFGTTIEINQSFCGSYLVSNNEYYFSENITCLGNDGFLVSGNQQNVTVNCNGYSYFGNSSRDVMNLFNEVDFRFYNCNFVNFSRAYLAGPDGFEFINVSFVNFSDNNAIYTSGLSNSLFKNIVVENPQLNAFYMHFGVENVTFRNISISDANVGLAFVATESNNLVDGLYLNNVYLGIKNPINNSVFRNLDLRNTTTPIDFDNTVFNLTFENSYMGNTSNILGFSSGGTDMVFSNNYYENFNGSSPFCVYSTVCDTNPNFAFVSSLDSASSSSFPSLNLIPILLILFIFFLTL
ncbi:MAG: hypothetical protein VXZ40_01530 [Nanoarchaeota archaeon]|nr:hypothetical protein [Nanoarchaeota archaeon]